MKKWCYFLPVLLLLTGCASQKIDTTPVWQETLPNTGVEMQLSNCILLNTYHVDYAESRENSDQVVNRDALNTQGVPVITLYGVPEGQVELRFVENISYLYLYYDKMMPQPDLDYVLTELEDGGLQYRLDTVYTFDFVITTQDGTDSMIVTCQRPGLESESSWS